MLTWNYSHSCNLLCSMVLVNSLGSLRQILQDAVRYLITLNKEYYYQEFKAQGLASFQGWRLNQVAEALSMEPDKFQGLRLGYQVRCPLEQCLKALPEAFPAGLPTHRLWLKCRHNWDAAAREAAARCKACKASNLFLSQ